MVYEKSCTTKNELEKSFLKGNISNKEPETIGSGLPSIHEYEILIS